jgi:Tc5 transposase DNA-binding domain
VSLGRVRRRFLGLAASRIDAGGQNKTLNKDDDKALCLYIDFCDDVSLPIREKTLVVAANTILQNHQFHDGPLYTVLKMWASRWLSRHPEYSKKARKPLAAVRKNTHYSEGLNTWFKKFAAVRERYGIIN